MTPIIADPNELRRRGFESLVSALGWVNAVRFIHQYETGEGDYTRDRDPFLPNRDAATIVRNVQEIASRPSRNPRG